jgi:hypothetical protein
METAMTTQPLLILDTFTIKGRGLVITGYPAAEPLVGGAVTAPDGRRWTVAGVERFLGRAWRPEDGAGILLARGGSEPLPVKGETVMVETVAAPAQPDGPRTFDRVAVYVDGHRLRENEAMDLTATADDGAVHTIVTWTGEGR